jgi:hypothetical protein
VVPLLVGFDAPDRGQAMGAVSGLVAGVLASHARRLKW